MPQTTQCYLLARTSLHPRCLAGKAACFSILWLHLQIDCCHRFGVMGQIPTSNFKHLVDVQARRSKLMVGISPRPQGSRDAQTGLLQRPCCRGRVQPLEEPRLLWEGRPEQIQPKQSSMLWEELMKDDSLIFYKACTSVPFTAF